MQGGAPGEEPAPAGRCGLEGEQEVCVTAGRHRTGGDTGGLAAHARLTGLPSCNRWGSLLHKGSPGPGFQVRQGKGHRLRREAGGEDRASQPPSIREGEGKRQKGGPEPGACAASEATPQGRRRQMGSEAHPGQALGATGRAPPIPPQTPAGGWQSLPDGSSSQAGWSAACGSCGEWLPSTGRGRWRTR